METVCQCHSGHRVLMPAWLPVSQAGIPPLARRVFLAKTGVFSQDGGFLAKTGVLAKTVVFSQTERNPWWLLSREDSMEVY